MATIAELRQQAATIKNATQVGENTANRVGTTFETVADLLDEEGGGGTGNLAFVDINDIDDIGDVSDMLAENPNIYTVTKTTGNTTTKVGTLIVFVNTNRYVLMQVLVSGYILNADGTLDTGGSDFTAKILWRGKWFNGTPPAGTSIGEWSSWLYLSGGGGGGDIDIDPYPISGSDNAVASGGVFDAIAAASTRKVNLNDIDSIGTYSDMLADVPTFYSVVETSGNNTFRTGTLMVFTNSNRYVILQVLVSGYITNEDGTQIVGSDFAAKILWRGKWFNGTPPAGTNIGEWSPWSSLGGGGGGSVDAYTKNETDALLARKQNVLTFDNTPTSGSTNPVTSGGVKTALDAKQATISDLSAIRGGAAAGATAYQKPAGGIPKTDLAADVQTSLGKADTALQEHQSLVNYYTKSEVNSLIVPQGVNAIPVAALPATGAANTLYFVQGTDSFTINAWDGTAWVTLATIAGTYDAGGALS